MTRTKLSRKTKGAIAAIAGGGLLLATGGTLAYWEAEASLPGSEITTGSLGLSAELRTPWAYTHDDPASTEAAWTPIANVVSGYLMVPGHTVAAEFEVTAEIDGTELIADLTIGGEEGIGSGIPGSVVTWRYWDTNSGTWSDPTTQTAYGPFTLASDLRADVTYEFQVQITLPFEPEVDNSSNSYGLAAPIQWSLEDAQILLTQQHPSMY